uniref:Protein CASC3 n=1 Tax=Saccoglossus kowalevskii TaxID=10224 RepID=A0ABM0M8R1_SACKO|nr:PREDICTED: protein CASC3-like [Saccoglossus kowalevskii]
MSLSLLRTVNPKISKDPTVKVKGVMNTMKSIILNMKVQKRIHRRMMMVRDLQKVISKGKEKEEERTSGDGQEESKDLAKDVTNPQYIPRRGPFFEHDVRMTSNKEDTNIRPKTKKKLWKEDDKWSHDMYREDEQTPKSREEIITMYGFDMRSGSLNDAGYPRPQRGRRMRGRQGPRPQFRDNRGFENNQNDNSQTDQTDMQYEQKESQYEWSQQQNNRPYYRRGGRNRGNMNYRGNDRRQSDSDAPYRENRSPVDKQIRSFGHGREWTNTNYKKQREDTINPRQGDGDGIHMHTSSVDRTSRETKSYMKDRRRPPTHRAPEEQESSTDAGNQDNKEMESNMEKLSITVEASHIGQGDHVPDRSIDANNSVVRPAPNSYTNSRHQPLNQDRNVQSKTQPQPQRSGHSTRPKRYSTQRQRQMPDPAPPPALHPPPLMDPQYFDPGKYSPTILLNKVIPFG